MTERERRLAPRWMNVARGLLINTPRAHHGLIKEYQKAPAEAWKIDDSGPERQAEFKRRAAEMNAAIAATFPDAANLRESVGAPPFKNRNRPGSIRLTVTDAARQPSLSPPSRAGGSRWRGRSAAAGRSGRARSVRRSAGPGGSLRA